jgi:hypothetical protein
LPPTKIANDSPAVTEIVAFSKPPAPPAEPLLVLSPLAPLAVTVMLLTPAGTMKACAPPV